MRSTKKVLRNFSRALSSQSSCVRPETEQELLDFICQHKQPTLARGAGLSYNDSCFNQDGLIIETQRLNHLMEFDHQSGIVLCQAGVTFKDLFSLNSQFIPPVIPGTLNVTLGGAIAHDVHGKNNHRAGSLGNHIVWFDLLVKNNLIRCSPEDHYELFKATIGGLGLTGVITRIALKLKKASSNVIVTNLKCDSLSSILKQMQSKGLDFDYQVAWLDLLNPSPRGVLSLANHCERADLSRAKEPYTIPWLPFNLMHSWNTQLINKYLFETATSEEYVSLERFNNPLDKIKNWNRLYGPKGLLQFQAVFDADNALAIIEGLIQIIKQHKVPPTLAVLKLFTQSGIGPLSFCQPGFTLAIDFCNTAKARGTIKAMNQMIVESHGRIYLAKDRFLTREQFQKMYPQHQAFTKLLIANQSPMHSDMAQRLGIV